MGTIAYNYYNCSSYYNYNYNYDDRCSYDYCGSSANYAGSDALWNVRLGRGHVFLYRRSELRVRHVRRGWLSGRRWTKSSIQKRTLRLHHPTRPMCWIFVYRSHSIDWLL
jgi:hypothetical protein